jgi:hypothetical protein
MDRIDSDWDAQIDEKSHLQEELTEPLLIVEKLSMRAIRSTVELRMKSIVWFRHGYRSS